MKNWFQAFFRFKYQLALGGLLVTASAISVVLARIHTRINGPEAYTFLIWNLILAWIPFIAALAAALARRNRITFYLVMPVCTLVWLIFFPNAPYLLTDFQHLAFTATSSPLWFDVLVLIWFAWTGLFLGVASLYVMQEIVTRTFNRPAGWVFAIVVTILSSFGVYLGRFLRWNSWDLLQDPWPIAKDIYGVVRHPIDNLPTYVFTILFTLLFLFVYLAVHLLGNIRRNPPEAARTQAGP